jgi:hypothetical protein
MNLRGSAIVDHNCPIRKVLRFPIDIVDLYFYSNNLLLSTGDSEFCISQKNVVETLVANSIANKDQSILKLKLGKRPIFATSTLPERDKLKCQHCYNLLFSQPQYDFERYYQ